MKIALASDHAGFKYKLLVKTQLESLGHQVVDFGTHSEDPCDYPDFCHPAAISVASGDCDRGIVFGGSGNGEAIVANRHLGIRCAVCWSAETARLARAHNDANMISIGQRLVAQDDLAAIVRTWLDEPFEGGRHVARIEKIDEF